MKRFLLALTLLCALSGTTLAGDIETCGITSPAPDATAEIVTPGDVPSGGSPIPGDVDTCGLSTIVLTVLDLVF